MEPRLHIASSMAEGHLLLLSIHLPMSYGHLHCLPGLFIALLVHGALHCQRASSIENGNAYFYFHILIAHPSERKDHRAASQLNNI